MKTLLTAKRVKIPEQGTYDVLACLEMESTDKSHWWELILAKTSGSKAEAWLSFDVEKVVLYLPMHDKLKGELPADLYSIDVGNIYNVAGINVFITDKYTATATSTTNEVKANDHMGEYRIAEGFANKAYITLEFDEDGCEMYMGQLISGSGIEILS